MYVWILAEQSNVAEPPLSPVQLQVQGPVPLTAEGVPVPQRSVAGAAINVWPLAVPQVPLPMKVIASEQLPVIGPVVYIPPLPVPDIWPPQDPLMPTLYPLSAVTVNAAEVPWLTVRLAGSIVPPLPTEGTIVYVRMFAEQSAIVPPLTPAQLHVQGPLPLTADATPIEHRSVTGASVGVWPPAVPQTPLPAKVIVSAQLPVTGPVV